MRLFTATTTPEELVGQYGTNTERDDDGYTIVVGRRSLLIDHTDLFETAGGTIRVGKHSTWAVLPGGEAVPVVCGDLVPVRTEDGPSDARCGCNVVGDRGACEGHADERDAYRAQSESERAYDERVRDQEGDFR
jgi:hypothetical protein